MRKGFFGGDGSALAEASTAVPTVTPGWESSYCKCAQQPKPVLCDVSAHVAIARMQQKHRRTLVILVVLTWWGQTIPLDIEAEAGH